MTDVNPKPVAKEDLKGKFTRPDNYVLDDEQRERITIARVQLLMNHAFFGNLATRLRIVEASDWCPTAATDGRHFYYNQYFVMYNEQDHPQDSHQNIYQYNFVLQNDNHYSLENMIYNH